MWFLLTLNEQCARLTNQPLTVINVLFCLVLSVPIGYVYRTVLHPNKVSPNVRHGVGLVVGIAFAWVCLKRELFLLVGICAMCYMLTCATRPTVVHKLVFGVSFSALLIAQIYRMIQNYGSNDFDYTGRFMLIVQKVTYVACSLHDGCGRKESELTNEQKQEKISKSPNLLEYFGYMFHYSGFLVGPTCTYQQYMDFIEGKDIARARFQCKGKKCDPSPAGFLWRHVFFIVFFLLATVLITPKFPINRNGDPEFAARSPFLYRCFYAWLSIAVLRFKYYMAFMLGECSMISCGLGFSGYDEHGNEQWENSRNINVVNVEFPTSLKMVVDNWNVSTAKWLRSTVHARVPHSKIEFTFLASILWHGVYPGYFMVAIAAFPLQQSSKLIRRSYRHVYKDLSPLGQRALLSVQIAVNIILLTYVTIPFPLLRLDLGFQFHKSMYFFGHIVCTLGLVFLTIRADQPHPKHLEGTAVNELKPNHKAATTKNFDMNGVNVNNNPLHLRQNHSHFNGI